MTGRRASDRVGAEMTEQYLGICREEFHSINEKVSRIEQKIYNGFDGKITATEKTMRHLDQKIEGLQKMIIGLILSVLGATFTIIMAMVFI